MLLFFYKRKHCDTCLYWSSRSNTMIAVNGVSTRNATEAFTISRLPRGAEQNETTKRQKKKIFFLLTFDRQESLQQQQKKNSFHTLATQKPAIRRVRSPCLRARDWLPDGESWRDVLRGLFFQRMIFFKEREADIELTIIKKL